MLKRLYTLFIIIAMTASSTIKAEETVYPTLTTQGGTYELVTSTSQIVDGGVYLIADNSSSTLYLMTTIEEENNRFSSVSVANGFILTPEKTPKSSLSFPTVNASNTPYEFVFVQSVKGWYIKDKNNYYITSGRTTSNASSSVTLSETNSTKASLFTIRQNNASDKTFAWEILNTSSVESNFDGDGGYFRFMENNSTHRYVYFYRKVVSSPEPPSPTTVPFVMSAVGYATLYYGTKDVTLPEGLTANTYTLNETQEKVYLTPSHTYNAGDVIPAGVAVVVKGNAGNYDLTISDPAEDPVKYDNVLKGYDTDTDLSVKANTCYYKLSINSEGNPNSVGFYWGAADGAPFNTKAHKAYLEITNSQAAKQIVSILDPDGDNTTGISSVKTQVKGSAEYDLGGMKTSKSVNGIKIKNGKKYFVIVK